MQISILWQDWVICLWNIGNTALPSEYSNSILEPGLKLYTRVSVWSSACCIRKLTVQMMKKFSWHIWNYVFLIAIVATETFQPLLTAQPVTPVGMDWTGYGNCLLQYSLVTHSTPIKTAASWVCGGVTYWMKLSAKAPAVNHFVNTAALQRDDRCFQKTGEGSAV